MTLLITIHRYWANVGIAIQWPIERAELGRNRNEPGDGFRYVFRSGTGGTGGRAEWFEVTEVFEGVEAKDIEAFMRLENGGEGYPDPPPARDVAGIVREQPELPGRTDHLVVDGSNDRPRSPDSRS